MSGVFSFQFNGPWLSCRAAFVTEPAVPLTAGGPAQMVAPSAANGKAIHARLVSCSAVLGGVDLA